LIADMEEVRTVTAQSLGMYKKQLDDLETKLSEIRGKISALETQAAGLSDDEKRDLEALKAQVAAGQAKLDHGKEVYARLGEGRLNSLNSLY
ncbi:hypothetical protein, partial [Mesorhizobium japonicum]|uniref:hypothetical protein n=1 Tax=Mesorhizobium japonicum TaxID=2066070 RepID=UPI003B5BE0EB